MAMGMEPAWEGFIRDMKKKGMPVGTILSEVGHGKDFYADNSKHGWDYFNPEHAEELKRYIIEL
jgi:hypothetical protein